MDDYMTGILIMFGWIIFPVIFHYGAKFLFGRSETEAWNEEQAEISKRIADSVGRNPIHQDRIASSYKTMFSRERFAGYLGLGAYFIFLYLFI